MAPEQIAQVCYEVSRAYIMATGGQAYPHWTNAPQEQREKMIERVHVHLGDPEVGPKNTRATKEKPSPLDTDFIFREVVLSLADGV